MIIMFYIWYLRLLAIYIPLMIDYTNLWLTLAISFTAIFTHGVKKFLYELNFSSNNTYGLKHFLKYC